MFASSSSVFIRRAAGSAARPALLARPVLSQTQRRNISVGSKIPAVQLKEIVGDAINDVSSTDFFKGKKIVLVGLPAAFSPTCSEKHVPGFLAHIEDFKKKGVDKVAVLAVNDFFTMKAWAKTQNVGDKLSFLADGNGEMTKALGVELDLKKVLLGVRSKRFSMVVEDGVVKAAAIEPDGTGYTTSSAENTLKQV